MNRLFVPRGCDGGGKRDLGFGDSGFRGPEEHRAAEDEIGVVGRLRPDGPEFAGDGARVGASLLEESEELWFPARAPNGGVKSRDGPRTLVGDGRARKTRGRFRGNAAIAESAAQEGETLLGARPIPPLVGGNGHHVLVELLEELLAGEPASSGRGGPHLRPPGSDA